jgi:hypothetical protein
MSHSRESERYLHLHNHTHTHTQRQTQTHTSSPGLGYTREKSFACCVLLWLLKAMFRCSIFLCALSSCCCFRLLASLITFTIRNIHFCVSSKSFLRLRTAAHRDINKHKMSQYLFIPEKSSPSSRWFLCFVDEDLFMYVSSSWKFWCAENFLCFSAALSCKKADRKKTCK